MFYLLAVYVYCLLSAAFGGATAIKWEDERTGKIF